MDRVGDPELSVSHHASWVRTTDFKLHHLLITG